MPSRTRASSSASGRAERLSPTRFARPRRWSCTDSWTTSSCWARWAKRCASNATRWRLRQRSPNISACPRGHARRAYSAAARAARAGQHVGGQLPAAGCRPTVRIDDLGTASVIQCIDRLPGLRLTQGREVITAQAADSETAAHLGIEPGTPILLVERALQIQSGRTVDFAQFHYLGHPQSVRLSRVRR